MATAFNDTISGSNGNDTIHALAGDDVVLGLFGDDEIYGGSGNDLIYTHHGNDRAFGMAGNDTLTNELGNDSLYGGEGDDFLNLGFTGLDIGGLALGGLGDDTIQIGSTHRARVDGQAGIDTLKLIWSDAPYDGSVTVDLATNTAHSSLGNFLDYSNFERLWIATGAGNDSLSGGDLDNFFSVQRGNDLVEAKGGDDFVSYSAQGQHTLYGGAGEDTLAVATTNSSLYFIIDGLTGEVDDGNLSVIAEFEHYVAQGSSLNDIASFGGGNDAFYGYGASDTVYGGAGNDSLLGYNGEDFIFGGAGNDTCLGGGGSDHISGGRGRDFLNGGRGADTLTGGAGYDVFTIGRTENQVDLITDFETGIDRLRVASVLLQDIGLSTGQLASDRFSLGVATGTEGQFVLTYDALLDQSTLIWDGNGSLDGGVGRLTVLFSGNVALTAEDIFLI